MFSLVVETIQCERVPVKQSHRAKLNSPPKRNILSAHLSSLTPTYLWDHHTRVYTVVSPLQSITLKKFSLVGESKAASAVCLQASAALWIPVACKTKNGGIKEARG